MAQGLIFQTLPIAFAQIPAGNFIAIVFFTLLSLAAITSMVGFLEPLVAWLSETKKVGRERATVTMIFLLGTLGLASVLSYSTFSEIQIIGRDLNGILDFLSSQITLPIGGLLIALFIGWRVGENTLRSGIKRSF